MENNICDKLKKKEHGYFFLFIKFMKLFFVTDTFSKQLHGSQKKSFTFYRGGEKLNKNSLNNNKKMKRNFHNEKIIHRSCDYFKKLSHIKTRPTFRHGDAAIAGCYGDHVTWQTAPPPSPHLFLRSCAHFIDVSSPSLVGGHWECPRQLHCNSIINNTAEFRFFIFCHVSFSCPFNNIFPKQLRKSEPECFKKNKRWINPMYWEQLTITLLLNLFT